MHTALKIIALAFTSLIPVAGFAADYDGSKALICATVEARDCVLNTECFAGEANVVGAPAFFRVDFAKKLVYGPERNSPIASSEQSPTALLLQGSEIGYGWTVGINKQTGNFSASMTNFEGTFLMYGNCTLL
jgi:hypothetical protein